MKTIFLGAGISGLIAAYRYKQNNPHDDFIILEKNKIHGGWINTYQQDGFTLEQGPRGIRPHGKGQQVLDIIQQLGLMDRVILSDPCAKQRFIYHNKLIKVPTNPLKIPFSDLGSIILKALKTDLKLNSFPYAEESLAQFSTRHFGQEFTDIILQPVVSGIWAGDIHQLSAMATLPKLCLLEQKEGSLIKSFFKNRPKKEAYRYPKSFKKAALFSFKNGLQELPDALSKVLADHIVTDTTIENISFENLNFTIKTNQKEYDAQRIISSIPAHSLAPIAFNLDKAFSYQLDKIKYAPMVIVSLAYQEKVHPIKGFGYLNVKSNANDILGVIMNDQTFPEHAPSTGQSLTIMLGGATSPDMAQLSESEILALVKQRMQEQLNITQKPFIEKVLILPKAIPQYNLGYIEDIKTLKTLCPRHFHLVGNYMQGVSIIDTVEHAIETVDSFFK